MNYCLVALGIITLFMSTLISMCLKVPERDELDFYYFRDHFPKGKGKTVTLFGATGNIGKEVIKMCLVQDYEVVAYVRNASKLSYRHKRLTVIEGELSDAEKIGTALKNTTAIISCLGPVHNHKDESNDVSEGYKNIISEAKKHGVERLICIGSSDFRCIRDANDTIKVKYPRIYSKLVYPNYYKEFNKIEQSVFNSGLKWTIIRFVRHDDSPSRGHFYIQYGQQPFEATVSREDIAMFAVCALSSDEFVYELPIIGY